MESISIVANITILYFVYGVYLVYRTLYLHVLWRLRKSSSLFDMDEEFVSATSENMFEPCYVSTFLSGTITTTGISCQEYVRNLVKVAVKRHNQSFPRTNSADVIAAINLSKVRLLRLDGKVWGQLISGTFVWLVTKDEWVGLYMKMLAIDLCCYNRIRSSNSLRSRPKTNLADMEKL